MTFSARRRTSRAVAAAAVVGATLLLAALPLSAAPAVAQQAWTRTDPESLVSAPADPGFIYTAATGGEESARAFVRLSGATEVSGLELHLREAGDSVLADAAVIIACLITSAWTGEGEIAAERAPSHDCTVSAAGRRAADGTWSFDLEAASEAWRGGTPDHGIALVSDAEAASDTWRVAFDITATRATGIEERPVDSAPGAEPAPQPPARASLEPASAAALPFAPAPLDVEQSLTPVIEPRTDQSPVVDPDAPATHRQPREADVPSAASVFGVLLGLALLAGAILIARRPALAVRLRSSIAASSRRSSRVATVVAAVAFVTVPAGFDEPTVYKLGLVLIFAMAAMGLHVLVNWTGQLSLGHAGVVGLPAFVVAKAAASWEISAIVLLPLGLLVGATVGAVISLPALRARGLYVAVVTLAAGVAIDRFFFTRTWLIGTGNVAVATPTLGPFDFPTNRSLYPVLAVVFLAVIGGLRALYRSKLGRALRWVKVDPDGAAASGVAVGTYKILAYVLAGGLAGIAGGLTPMWVSRVTAQAFPVTLSFAYLSVVVLAGAGGLAGVVAGAALLEGARVFVSGASGLIAYGGPIALIITLTRMPTGLNGAGRVLMQRLQRVMETVSREAGGADRGGRPEVEAGFRRPWRAEAVGGTISVVVGLIMIGLAWYHSGNTDQLWVQNQELVSGGFGGLAVVAIGVGLLVRDRMARLEAVLTRIADAQSSDARVHLEAAATDEVPGTAGSSRVA